MVKLRIQPPEWQKGLVFASRIDKKWVEEFQADRETNEVTIKLAQEKVEAFRKMIEGLGGTIIEER